MDELTDETTGSQNMFVNHLDSVWDRISPWLKKSQKNAYFAQM